MNKFQKALIMLLGLFIVWLFLYLIFFDTYWFKFTASNFFRCNRKTGEIEILSIKRPEEGWLKINKRIKELQFQKAMEEAIKEHQNISSNLQP